MRIIQFSMLMLILVASYFWYFVALLAFHSVHPHSNDHYIPILIIHIILITFTNYTYRNQTENWIHNWKKPKRKRMRWIVGVQCTVYLCGYAKVRIMPFCYGIEKIDSTKKHHVVFFFFFFLHLLVPLFWLNLHTLS